MKEYKPIKLKPNPSSYEEFRQVTADANNQPYVKGCKPNMMLLELLGLR